MKFKVYFRKNLKMTPQKLAAQVSHVVKELGRMQPNSDPQEDVIVVLQASDKKFEEIKVEFADNYNYLQVDLGMTEVPAGTETCFGYIEECSEELTKKEQSFKEAIVQLAGRLDAMIQEVNK